MSRRKPTNGVSPAVQPHPPIILAIGIVRETGAGEIHCNATSPDDWAKVANVLAQAGQMVQAKLLEAAEARGRAAAEKTPG